MDGISYVQPLRPKLPAALQLSANLAAYISSAYNQDPKQYMSELKELEAMREAAINCPVNASSIESLDKYIRELQVLPSRFPVDEDNIKLAIGWFNAFPADRGVKPLAYFSLQYEQAAVMFNLGVLLARLGNADVAGKSVDCLRKACAYYMQASGVFLETVNVSRRLQLSPSSDLDSAVLVGLADLMLAQAQECCFWKGVADGSRDGAMAKVAMAASELYSSASSKFGDVPVLTGSNEGRSLLSATAAKSCVLHIIAELKRAGEERQTKKFGEEIGRLTYIGDQLLPKLASLSNNKDLQPVCRAITVYATDELNRARKDNLLIYHEIPVPRSQLPTIVSFTIVKTTPYKIGETAGIFDCLIPLRLHQATTRYQRAKVERVNLIVSELEKIKQLLTGALQKHNLPGALEAIEQPIGLPNSLIVKMRELQSHGGMSGLQASVALIQQLSLEVSRELAGIEGILGDESREDERFRSMFGSEWKRLRSRQAACSYFEKVDQVRAALHTAADADAVIRGRLERYGRDLEILCGGSVEAVSLLIPTSHSTNRLPPAARIAVDRLRQWIRNTDSLLSDINKTISELNAQSDNDHPLKALSAVTSDEKINSAVANELDKYGKYSGTINVLTERAQAHIGGAELIMREFGNATTGSGADSHERQSALQRLDDAYKHYLLINKDLADGIRFYTSLQDPLARLRSDVADYAACRQVDAEELAGGLQRAQSPVRTPTSAFPAAAAPSELWPVRGNAGAYPANMDPGQYTWTPGMPISYAKK